VEFCIQLCHLTFKIISKLDLITTGLTNTVFIIFLQKFKELEANVK